MVGAGSRDDAFRWIKVEGARGGDSVYQASGWRDSPDSTKERIV